MKFMKRAFGEFRKFHIKMTTNVRFCISYEPLKWDFNDSKIDNISRRIQIDTDVVNGFKSTRQTVITRKVI